MRLPTAERLFTAALCLFVLSCGPDVQFEPDELGSVDGALLKTADLSGRWEGTVDVVGTQFLKTGTYPAVIHLVQSGTRVRGVLDVHAKAAEFAEWFGYYIEGTVIRDELTIELTDRACGAGEPEGLCYPAWDGKAKVFTAKLKRKHDGLSATSIAVKDGVSYPDGRAIEPPFRSLKATHISKVGGKPLSSLIGTWKGPFNPPESVVFGGQRWFGTNSITFSSSKAGIALTRFDNNQSNIYPTHDDLIFADTFRYDPATRRFWFLEAGTVYGVYLWVGELRGDTIVGHFVSEALSGGAYAPDKLPVDPFTIPFRDFEATFILKRQ